MTAVGKAPGTAGRHGSGAAIVHGDFRVDNTILAPADIGRVRAVVDWELSTLGDPLADLGTFLAYRDPAVDALLGTPAATAPGFPGPDELAERYALFSGRDLSALPFYRALAHFKIAVIAEGVHARHLKGVTVGDGFAGPGPGRTRRPRARTVTGTRPAHAPRRTVGRPQGAGPPRHGTPGRQ
ncbi:phosphotransferase [Actinacidiphila sp. bgisy144]|uniref:phosphotransferase n=1 Tax=Actinacidiphila sp. bgisy144 TaxID=3413791 RepID=UPI003EB9FE5F